MARFKNDSACAAALPEQTCEESIAQAHFKAPWRMKPQKVGAMPCINPCAPSDCSPPHTQTP
eukprot:2332819-Rhodomonas_salina.1